MVSPCKRYAFGARNHTFWKVKPYVLRRHGRTAIRATASCPYVCRLYSMGLMPVMRLKNLQKKLILGNFMPLAISLSDLSV